MLELVLVVERMGDREWNGLRMRREAGARFASLLESCLIESVSDVKTVF